MRCSLEITGVALALVFGCGEDEPAPMAADTTGGATSATDSGSGADTADAGACGTTGSTGGEEDTVKDKCMATCERLDECMIAPGGDICLLECLITVEMTAAECPPLHEALMSCLVGMTCEQFMEYYENGTPGVCAQEDQAVEANGCWEIGCSTFGSSDGESECSTAYDCAGEPEYGIKCTGEQCTCLVDGVPNGDSCPAETICQEFEDLEALTEKAVQCCGFPPPLSE